VDNLSYVDGVIMLVAAIASIVIGGFASFWCDADVR
jgi:hypothetical protein